MSGCALAPQVAQTQDNNSKSLENANTANTYSNRENALTQASQDGLYRISLYSDEFPPPLNKIHSWTVRVLSPEGKPEESVKLTVHGGMPAHQHDFPTKPRVTQYLGDGYYKVEGVKFSMPGQWEMRFNVKEEARLKRDRVVFDIHL